MSTANAIQNTNSAGSTRIPASAKGKGTEMAPRTSSDSTEGPRREAKLNMSTEPTPTKKKRASWNVVGRLFRPSSLDERKSLEEALQFTVTNSNDPSRVLVGEVSTTHASKHIWLSHLFNSDFFDKLFAKEHLGNFVIVRGSGEKEWESMPIYARIGMHLLFYGPLQIRLLGWSRLRKLLKAESVRQGLIFDSTDPEIVIPHIHHFIETYNIDLTELLEPDVKGYKTFNEFFSRKLRPDARPASSPDDLSIIVSAADCRLTVWPTWEASRRVWVKGRNFKLSTLLQNPKLVDAIGPNPSLAVFRLAPQDYHRFHAPVGGKLVSIAHIEGEYYTVNPQAVNESLDVFTANVRSVLWLRAKVASSTGAEPREVAVAIVAVGALLVGSIRWDKKVGESIDKGEGLGYFRYGGSTVICVLPQGVMWDADLVKQSSDSLETLVKAGEKIGQMGRLD